MPNRASDRFHVLDQPIDTAKESFAAGEVEKQHRRQGACIAIGIVPASRNDRRETNEPSSQRVERTLIAGGIFVDAMKVRAQRRASAALMPSRTPCDSARGETSMTSRRWPMDRMTATAAGAAFRTPPESPGDRPVGQVEA